MTRMTLDEAAEALGVGRRRVAQLAHADRLGPVHRVGRNLLLDAVAVQRFAQTPRAHGRVFTAPAAWGALDLLSGGRAPWLAADRRSRVRTVLRKSSADDVVRLVADRARAHRFRAVGEIADDLRAAVVPTGTSVDADRLYRLGLSAVSDGTVDGYLTADRLPRYVAEFGLIPDESGAVTLRAVVFGEPFADGRLRDAAIAVDLAESLDPRVRRSGLGWLARLLADFETGDDR
ncbi:hypothetical protein MYK68_14540 [Gordonia sp. PP30]|uniref:hypothetical protein n=2 Tax=Gordonia TaxID=2053 RepID=UPI001FFFE535|nr:MULTISPECIES: hypothetical protein [unclassified Gordonia (in: high G+C Gram-positive bacteria)]UQE73947.1 hypothetical protein MYK68_14540 [Gordonia sp. PP30]